MSKGNVLFDLEMKCTRILCLELFCVYLGSHHLSSAVTVDICKYDAIHGNTVSLELSLSDLTQYEGHCTCDLNRINKPGNVTMEAAIKMGGCDSLSLHVEGWDYQALCDERPVYEQTQFFVLGQTYRIYMNRSLGVSTPSIAGSITFKSQNTDKLALTCLDSSYVIPSTTTTQTTTTLLTTTTPAPSPLPTILGIAGGVLIGFILFLIIICVCIRYRKKRQRAHNAKLVNKRGVLPNEDRERIDPEMTRLSWHKSIPFRLKRLYMGESRKNKESRQSAKGLNLNRSAKGLSQVRMRNSDSTTGTKAGKTLQRLFRTKSSTSSFRMNSRQTSTIEDNLPSSEVKDDGPNDQDVFPEVDAQRGGGIFMDIRRTSCETLDQAGYDRDCAGVDDCRPLDGIYAETSDIAGVSVHREDVPKEENVQKETVASEEELVSSLFGDYDDVPDSASPKDSEACFDDNYASVDGKQISGPAETTSIESASATKDGVNTANINPSLSIKSEDGGEADSLYFSVDGDVYSTVNKHKMDVSNIEKETGFDEIDNTEDPETKDDMYAVVDKSSISKKQVSFFRT